jgi:hypothetical protein
MVCISRALFPCHHIAFLLTGKTGVGGENWELGFKTVVLTGRFEVLLKHGVTGSIEKQQKLKEEKKKNGLLDFYF